MNIIFEEAFINIARDKHSLFVEDMSVLSNKTLGIDADILLRKVKASAKKSLQEGHSTLDMTVQRSIIDIIQRFKNEFKIDLVIVLDGLTPKCLSDADKILEKSKSIWDFTATLNANDKSSNMKLKEAILQQYGVRFYQQEIINAAKLTKTQFFIAPYLSSAQIVYFYKEEMIHACCGSSKILLYDQQQAIIDFDLDRGQFTFIDSGELIEDFGIKTQDRINTRFIVDFFILCGALFNKKITILPQQQNTGTLTQTQLQVQSINEILQKLKEAEKARPSDKSAGQYLIETTIKDPETRQQHIRTLLTLRAFLIDAPPVLTRNLELGNLRRNNANDFIYSDLEQFMGYRFNNEIYYFMSKGLIDPQILETISNNQIITQVVVAPNMILRDIWESGDFKQFFYESFNNLHEDFKEDAGKAVNGIDKRSLDQFYDSLQYKKSSQLENQVSKWSIVENDIMNELDRTGLIKVSFVFVLKWFQYEQRQKGAQRSHLLEFIDGTNQNISTNKSKLKKLSTLNELLAMCYFQYLENRKFLSNNTEFLYGKLLQTAPQANEQSVIIFLEMLKIYFPAGQPIQPVSTHKQYADRYNLLNPQDSNENHKIAILLISRIFSLFQFKSEAIENGVNVDIKSFDYDMAEFCTYIRQLKVIMKSTFQTILYRIFRTGRANVELFPQAIDMLAFSKDNNCIFGLVMKSYLQRNSLEGPYFGFQGSILEEFPFLTMPELKQGLIDGCNLWKKILFIHSITLSNQQVSDKLKQHFSIAQKYLVDKMRQHGEIELVNILEADSL